MRSPKMIFYLDDLGISRLHEQMEGGTLVEKSRASGSEDSQEFRGGVEAGGGFLAILNLAKLSLGTSKGKKRRAEAGQKLNVGSYAHFDLVIDALKSRLRGKYFDSLDTAFESAPEAEAGCYWVCVNDKFSL